MVENQYKTINDIAKELDLPETTVRRYFSTFREYFTGQTFGRILKYPEKSCEIVTKIYELYKAGKNTDEIKLILKEHYQQVIEIKSTVQEYPQTLTDLINKSNEIILQNTEALKLTSEILTRVLDQGNEIQELREEIRLLKEKKSIVRRITGVFRK